MVMKRKRGHEYPFTQRSCPFHAAEPMYLERGRFVECIGCGTVLRMDEFYFKRGTDGRRRVLFAAESNERAW